MRQKKSLGRAITLPASDFTMTRSKRAEQGHYRGRQELVGEYIYIRF